MPFQGRDLELGRLAEWLSGDFPCYVLGGPAGAGKTRLALEAARRAQRWTTGWLRPGEGARACSAVRECGEPTLVLADDADLRDDLLPLLDQVFEHHHAGRAPAIRVLLVTRSAQDFIQRSRAVAGGRRPGHAVLPDWATLTLDGCPCPPGEVFRDAVSAFAAVLGVGVAETPAGPVPPWPDRGAAEPFGGIVARALLLVLDAARGEACPGPPERDPRAISRAGLAARLIRHEQDRWSAATEWDWGDRDPPSRALRDRVMAALTLLGADSEATARSVLRMVPMPRDAPAGLRGAIASWTASLYPPGARIGISPHLVGEWFVVRQLAGSPLLERSLRAELTQEQRTRALGVLGRAARHVRGADRLFAEFAAGDADSLAIAITQAAGAGAGGRVDALIAGQVRSPRAPAPGGWDPVQLARFGAMAAMTLPRTRVAVAVARVAHYRALAARSAVYWFGLAEALRELDASLVALGHHWRAWDARREALTLSGTLFHATDGFPQKLRYLLSPVNEQAARPVLRVARQIDDGDRSEYRRLMPQLAWRLHISSLNDSALNDTAVDAAREAVAAERAFPAATFQAASTPSRGLAALLSLLGDALARAGHYPEAVLATRDAVSRWRPGDGQVRSLADAGYPEALLALSSQLGQAGHPQEARTARDRALRVIRQSLVRDGTYQHRSAGRLGQAFGTLGGDAAARLVAELEHEGLTIAEPAGTLVIDRPARLVAELAYEALTVVGTGAGSRPAMDRGGTLEGGRLDIGVLLAEFAAFWRRHGGVPGKKGRYPGAAPDQVFTALLGKLVDGIGTVELRSQEGERGPVRRRGHRRTEILVRTRYPHPAGANVEQRTAIQLTEEGTRSRRRWGQSAGSFLRSTRMDEYLARHALQSGALVIFDRRPRPAGASPDPRLSKARTTDRRDITVLTC